MWVQILPQAPYAVLAELVRHRIANPWSEETLREFKSLRLRQGSERTLSVSIAHYGGSGKQMCRISRKALPTNMSHPSSGLLPFQRGTLIVTAVGVLLLYKGEDLWYKKDTPGSWWFPCVSFLRLEFYFFLQPERSSSWRALLLFGYGAAAVRLVVELTTDCHQLGVGVASAITFILTVKSSPTVTLFLHLLEKIMRIIIPCRI